MRIDERLDLDLTTLTDNDIKELKDLLTIEHKKRGAKNKGDIKIHERLVEMGFVEHLKEFGFEDASPKRNYSSDIDDIFVTIDNSILSLCDFAFNNYTIIEKPIPRVEPSVACRHVARRSPNFINSNIYKDYLNMGEDILKVFEKYFKWENP